MPRRVERTNALVDWAMKNAALLASVFGLLVTFYFTTKAQLDNHEKAITEIAKRFDGFNVTQDKNFASYTSMQKEEAATREKTRNELMALFTQLATNSAASKVQVDSLSKTLDGVVNKLDTIQSNQRLPQGARK